MKKNQEKAHSILSEIWRQILQEITKIIESGCFWEAGIEVGKSGEDQDLKDDEAGRDLLNLSFSG